LKKPPHKTQARPRRYLRIDLETEFGPELARRVKVRAAQEGRTMQAVASDALREYLSSALRPGR
jgi:hypothetical protein